VFRGSGVDRGSCAAIGGGAAFGVTHGGSGNDGGSSVAGSGGCGAYGRAGSNSSTVGESVRCARCRSGGGVNAHEVCGGWAGSGDSGGSSQEGWDGYGP
jgi:hypothetical protein